MATKPRPAKPTLKPASPAAKVHRKAVRKDSQIIIRVTAEQKEILRAAAAKGGFGLSGWILSTAMRAATRDE